MRYLVGFVFVLGLVTSPRSASAQSGGEAITSEPTLREPTPSAPPAPEEPALQLELDNTGVEVAPSAPQAVDGYTLEVMELRVKRARIGLISTAAAMGVGGAFVAIAVAHRDCGLSFTRRIPQWCNVVGNTGLALIFGGAAGVIATGILLGVRKRKMRTLEEADYGTPRRVQWDLARSRLVF